MNPNLLAFGFLLLGGCSTPTVQLPAPISVTNIDNSIFVLEQQLTIRAPHADPLTLRAGTHWRQIGAIEQGSVFDTDDQVVIVNSFDVHEAAVVVSEQHVVGLYLKVPKSFVEIQPVPITLTEGD